MGQNLLFTASDEAASRAFARGLSRILQAGHMVTFSGALGAGKSFLIRALIHYQRGAITVPSPSFSLIQHYDGILHADFYRLSHAEEIYELGLLDDLPQNISLIEWPEYGAGVLPPADIAIHIETIGESGETRNISVTMPDISALQAALARETTISEFINTTAHKTSQRQLIAGDASVRRYERLHGETTNHILMDWPQGADGPPVYEGKSYSALVHLAERADRFSQTSDYLRAQGLSAPAIYAAQYEEGLLLLEDLGDMSLERLVHQNHAMVDSAYFEAIETLVQLHRTSDIPALPLMDADVLAYESMLYLDWYLPTKNITVTDAMRDDWFSLWQPLFRQLQALKPVLILRDYHSPNLLWCDRRQAARRIGLIDVQDALIGSPAYDVVSLLQDARLDVPPDRQDFLLTHYLSYLSSEEQEAFRNAYAILGAQRNLKIAGIFIRLSKRDGKPEYMQHLPRIHSYIEENLAHPLLSDLRQFLAELEGKT